MDSVHNGKRLVVMKPESSGEDEEVKYVATTI